MASRRKNSQKAPERWAASSPPLAVLPPVDRRIMLYGDYAPYGDVWQAIEDHTAVWIADFIAPGDHRVSAWAYLNDSGYGCVGIFTDRARSRWLAAGCFNDAIPVHNLFGYSRYTGRGKYRDAPRLHRPLQLHRRHLDPGIVNYMDRGLGLGEILAFAQALAVVALGGDGTWSGVGCRSLSAEAMSLRLARRGLYYSFYDNGHQLEALLATTVLSSGVLLDVNPACVPAGAKVSFYVGK